MTPLAWVSKTASVRHAIRDLSENHDSQQPHQEKPVPVSLDLGLSRHPVASKRRPNSSKYIYQTPGSVTKFNQNIKNNENESSLGDIISLKEKSNETIDQTSVQLEETHTVHVHQSDSCDGSVTASSHDKFRPQVLFKHIQSRNCAIYEPVVTHKHYTTLMTAFDQCVDYLSEHSTELAPLCSDISPCQSDNTIQDLISSSNSLKALPSDVSCEEFLLCLKGVIQQYQSTLQQLDKNDSLLTSIIFSIEREHKELYEWKQTNMDTLIESEHKETPNECQESREIHEGSTESPKLNAEMYNERLKRLDMLKACLDPLYEQGVAYSQSLDTQISHVLKLTLSIIEKIQQPCSTKWDFQKDSSLDCCP